MQTHRKIGAKRPKNLVRIGANRCKNCHETIGRVYCKADKNKFIMAKLFYYLDTRSGKGEFPIKIRIQHKTKSLLSTGVKVAPDQWDEASGAIINHPHATTLNALIGSKMREAQQVIVNLEFAKKLNKYSAQQLKQIIENDGEIIELEEEGKERFLSYYIKCMESKKKPSTVSSYNQALNNLKKFDPKLEEKTFEDIDLKYINRLDAWFESRNISVNARAVYYRNIKAVFNSAINDEITDNYPFRRFKIKKTSTKKRNLSVEELRLLRDFPIQDEWQKKYRDIFMLMFYLRGINAADLFRLKPSDIRLGRLNYTRAKTGKPYSVKIEPEAKKIMAKYKGKQYILDICDGAKTEEEVDAKYKGFLHRMDRGLKKIGTYKIVGRGGKREVKPILPFLSQYWCRHTAATIMSELDIPNETIAAALGHEHGNKVTNIYIEYNEKKVDDANRKLIDFVNQK